MSRRALGLASVLLALSFLVTPAEAQLGGLAKKARQRVSETAGVPSTDQPARMAGPEVTTASVDQLLAGLKAEAATVERQAAAERQRQDQANAARTASDRQEQCYEDKKNSDPAWRLMRLVCLPIQPNPALAARTFSITGALSLNTR